ncbi:MAG: Arc family DNA-binding protein [Acholeplasmataceae bacterium]|nr:Arc family DNA-binding protein [Acholeplasmataceae bacterium]
MVIMELARFTLRIHPVILKKLKIISDNNGRSVNKEIEQILKWIVDDYENKCGKIEVKD